MSLYDIEGNYLGTYSHTPAPSTKAFVIDNKEPVEKVDIDLFEKIETIIQDKVNECAVMLIKERIITPYGEGKKIELHQSEVKFLCDSIKLMEVSK